jgi:hypothetical protein
MSRKSATKAKFAPHAGTQMAQLLEVQNENTALKEMTLELRESIADVQLALDNIGWSPLGGEYGDMRELPLATIRDQTRVTRALAVINPLIKRGIAVRIAYIWGNGIKLDGLDETSDFAKHAGNKKYLLSEKAQMEMESCLATDGNFFLLVTKKSAKSKVDRLTRVPLWQITGAVSDPDNAEDIWFYKREWNTVVTNAATEQETATPNVEYFPAIDYDEANGRPTQFKGKKVNWGSRIAAHSVNKQSGWKWGVPDILPVMFWAKAHKEFLESQATLVKAYSRFAWKVAAPTAANARAASTKVGTAPSIDPMTGQPQGVGATAVTGQGTTISSVGRTGGSVDFEAGLPLAGYVAAGLSVPLTELTADAGNANRSSAETLSGSNEKVMKARQAEHKMFYESIFAYLGMDVKVSFEKIEQEAVYRQIQSLVSLLPLNLFSDKEMRALIVHVLDLQELDPEKVPTKEELGNLILQATMAAEAADKAAVQAEKLAKSQPAPGAAVPGAKAPKVPGVKKAASTAKSYGDNSYRKDASTAARTGAKG